MFWNGYFVFMLKVESIIHPSELYVSNINIKYFSFDQVKWEITGLLMVDPFNETELNIAGMWSILIWQTFPLKICFLGEHAYHLSLYQMSYWITYFRYRPFSFKPVTHCRILRNVNVRICHAAKYCIKTGFIWESLYMKKQTAGLYIVQWPQKGSNSA